MVSHVMRLYSRMTWKFGRQLKVYLMFMVCKLISTICQTVTYYTTFIAELAFPFSKPHLYIFNFGVLWVQNLWWLQADLIIAFKIFTDLLDVDPNFSPVFSVRIVKYLNKLSAPVFKARSVNMFNIRLNQVWIEVFPNFPVQHHYWMHITPIQSPFLYATQLVVLAM